MRLVVLMLAATCSLVAAGNPSSSIKRETLVQTSSSWDGTSYKSYPAGRPELTVLKITLPPDTTMDWHAHPVPNAAYVLSGSLTVEKQDGTRKHFTAGQALAETVGTLHRGVTGSDGAVLIVFYAGTAGVPLSRPESRIQHRRPLKQSGR